MNISEIIPQDKMGRIAFAAEENKLITFPQKIYFKKLER